MPGNFPFSKYLTALTALFLVTASIGQTPDCPILTLPNDDAVGVSIATNLEWGQVANATGYFLTVGTSPGGTDILNNEDLGNVSTYDFITNLPLFQMIYVSLLPYNTLGNVGNCTELTFTTGGSTAPLCTEIINPTDGDALVSVTANITWIRDFNATGYRMTIYENDPNGILILNNLNVGNGTNFKPPDFSPRTTYFVTIVPFNDFGPALGCNPISFTTGDGTGLPFCSTLLSPEDGSIDVAMDPELQWAPIAGVDGYLLSVGTTPRGTEIVANENVGNTTTYQLAENLAIGQRIYVMVTPYKGQNEAENCPVTSFTVLGLSTAEIEDIVPRFFTPNNDSYNDEWVVQSTQNIIVQQVFIFNRYGKLLKQLLPEQPWDGTSNGSKLPSDTYWFIVDVLNAQRIRGHFLLKR